MINFTKLNAAMDTERDAEQGQGCGTTLKPRDLFSHNIKTPDEISATPKAILENTGIYERFISPEDIQFSRVVVQVTVSEENIALSSQLNNRINPTMENSSVKGGVRSKS